MHLSIDICKMQRGVLLRTQDGAVSGALGEAAG